MNVLDLFFKKFSYKFPKGYPDMKNEQDILLLESLISKILGEEIVLEKKLEWKDLSDETRKYYRLEVIADKIANGEPFKLENGKEEILKFDKDSYATLFKAQNVNDIRTTGGKNIIERAKTNQRIHSEKYELVNNWHVFPDGFVHHPFVNCRR